MNTRVHLLREGNTKLLMTEVLCGHIFILVLPICVVRKPCALEQDSSPLLQYPKLDTSCILLLKRSVLALCFLALSL